jgi:zinc/manganese transport system permease protein
VILAAGLGLGVLLLSYYHGFASAATNILFGQIFGVSTDDVVLLAAIATLVIVVIAVIYRPLLFASVDPDVAAARGVRTGLLGLIFVYLLALTVTEAAQVVGTLLVLSLAVTPAAAARRLSANPLLVTAIAVGFALLAADGGLLLSFAFDTIKPTVFVTFVSFATYLLARAVSGSRRTSGRSLSARRWPGTRPRLSRRMATTDSR